MGAQMGPTRRAFSVDGASEVIRSVGLINYAKRSSFGTRWGHFTCLAMSSVDNSVATADDMTWKKCAAATCQIR